MRRLVAISLVAAGLALGLPIRVVGQHSSAALAEADRLSIRIIGLRFAGRHDEALPLAERALAIRERVRGPKHPDVASSLIILAYCYTSKGDYERAEPLYLRALAIYEKVRGPEDPQVASSLHDLAFLYESKGDYGRAEPLFQRALTIREKTIPPRHLDVATSLTKLAALYANKGEYVRAEPLYQRALAIREKALGLQHTEVATSLHDLALLYANKREYERAEPLYQRALAIYEKVLGPEHAYVATSLNSLALLYENRGDYVRAEPLYQRALAIREKVRGPAHPEVATALNNLALLYQKKGDYVRAESLYPRALAIFEKVLGPEHPDVATSLVNLALLYEDRSNYERAEPLYQRALAIREKVRGPVHHEVATSLNILATLYHKKGDYVRAESLYQRALAIREKLLGPEHLDVANTLNGLAQLYTDKGDYVRAAPLHQRALAIYEKLLGPEHPDVAGSLNNLAGLYEEEGDYERAEPLFQRGLAIREKMLGPEHPDVANSLNNLAGLYAEKDDYVRAEPLYLRALAIREKVLGPEHPDVATSLNGLALLYQIKGDYTRAESLYQRSLTVLEKVFGPQHPHLALIVRNFATLYEAKGDLVRAVQFLRRADDTIEHNLSLILSTGSENQKQQYLNTLSWQTDHTVSLHVRSASNDPQAAELAVTSILRYKGRALDAMTVQINALRERAAPEDQQLLDRFAATQSQIAALRLSDGGTKGPGIFEQRLGQAEQLTTESENLQAEISRHSAEFRAQTQPVNLVAVQKALPADTALVELFSYRPFHVKAAKAADRFGAPHYIAYVLKHNGIINSVDLGPAETIDRAIDQFLDAISNPGSVNWKETGRALEEIVARPIRKLLGDVRSVLISPDGKLNLVPFAALVDERGRHLIENYTITYLTSGRDLLRLNVPRQSKQPPVVIANPAFNASMTSSKPDAALPTQNPAPANQSKPAPAGASGRRSGSMLSSNWSELRGTEEEAVYLKGLLPNARVLTGKDATESALKQVSAPRILHLATHGFFLPDQPRDPNDKAKIVGENPLLRSGLVLAGANNLQGGGGEDGVVTALEAATLNLWGTRLVVLSACDTGVGEVRSGEGVYGLRRALVLAGAESQVMTLWKVDDAATSEVIVEYYRRLQSGEGRSEALRQVQLEFLRRKTKQHPFFWASFIINGDWRSI